MKESSTPHALIAGNTLAEAGEIWRYIGTSTKELDLNVHAATVDAAGYAEGHPTIAQAPRNAFLQPFCSSRRPVDAIDVQEDDFLILYRFGVHALLLLSSRDIGNTLRLLTRRSESRGCISQFQAQTTPELVSISASSRFALNIPQRIRPFSWLSCLNIESRVS